MSARISVAVSFGANAFFFVVQFGTGVILARLLSPAEMGVYAVAMAAYWIINAVQNLGLASFLVREATLEPHKLGTVYAIAALQGLLLATILWFGAPVIAALSSTPQVVHAVRIMCLYALATSVMTTAGGLMQRRMQFVRFNAIFMLSNLVNAAVTLLLAFHGFSYLSMPWGATVGAFVASLVALWLVRHDLRVRPTLAAWREVWAFGSPMLTSNLIINGCARLPDILLARFGGIAVTGLYNRAAGLVDVFSNSVVASFQRVMQTLFVKQRDADGSFHDAYLRSVRIMTGLIWPAYAGLAVLAAPVISLLYGAKWLAAAPVLSLICVGAIVATSMACRSEALITAGDVRRLPRIEAIRGVLGVLLFAVAAQFGMVAAAASRIVDAAIAVALYARPVHRAARVSLSDAMRAYASSAIVTVAAITPAAAVMVSRSWPLSLPAGGLVVAIGGGAMLWLATVAAVRHELWREIVRAISALPGRRAVTAPE